VHREAVALVELDAEVLDQEANVVTPRAERWNLQDGPAQTVVEVLPKVPRSTAASRSR